MRRTLTLIVLLTLALAARGQAVDTAAQVVDRYLELLGNDRWPADSILVLKTIVTSPQSSDTFVLKRWYMPPQRHRIEVWLNDTLQRAFCGNGSDRFRRYDPSLGYWVDLSAYQFYTDLAGFDVRGPLYGWRSQGAALTYEGTATVMGRKGLETVKVEVPDRYTRHYFFEPSGLMSVIVETNDLDSLYRDRYDAHIDWKFIHEYQQVGRCLLPKQESFMRQGKLTVMETEAWLEPPKTLIFNQD